MDLQQVTPVRNSKVKQIRMFITQKEFNDFLMCNKLEELKE